MITHDVPPQLAQRTRLSAHEPMLETPLEVLSSLANRWHFRIGSRNQAEFQLYRRRHQGASAHAVVDRSGRAKQAEAEFFA